MAEADADDRGFTVKKKIDESWKNTVEKEKAKTPKMAEPPPESEHAGPPEVDFPFFVSTLGMQALVALGEVPNPGTGEKHADLANAKYLIDVLAVLSQKTKGNLTKEEAAMMQDLLYELQMKFVQKSQGS